MKTIEYLESVSKMRRDSVKAPDLWHYFGMEELVLLEGKEYELGPIPEGIPLGRPKYCFNNAFNVARRNPRLYAYCEGYASYIIPTHHAWNIDRKTGKAFDVTWAALDNMGDDKAGGYVGIEVPLYVYDAITMKSGHHGVVDAWEAEWPMLKRKLPDFQNRAATKKWLEEVL